MSKHTVTRIYVWSLIAIGVGIVLMLIAGGLGFAGTQFMMRGPDVVGVQPTSMTWVAASTGVLAAVALLVGGIGQLVAWVGAMVNTAQLPDKMWFILLLVLGLLGLGFIPMLVYVLTGPDGTAASTPSQAVTTTRQSAAAPKAA